MKRGVAEYSEKGWQRFSKTRSIASSRQREWNKKVDRTDEGESKNDGFATGSTDFATATDWENIAASLPQDWFVVTSFISLRIRVWMNTIATD